MWNLPIKEDTEQNASKLQREWDKEMHPDKKKYVFVSYESPIEAANLLIN